MTIIEIIKSTSEYFKKKNLDSPRLLIELLIADELNCNRMELYINFDKPLKDNELRNLRQNVARIAAHEPLQYVLGKTNFQGLEIKCDKRALIPRPETEELAKLVENDLKGTEKILEVGTGTGCISIYLAKKFPEIKIVALDISEEALELAKENAKLHNVNNIEFYKADIFQVVPKNKYDVFISNPPYIPTNEINNLDTNVKNNEPIISLDGGVEGVTFYKYFSSILQKVLVDNGRFYLEYGFGQTEKLLEIFGKYKTFVEKDFNNIERFIIGEKLILS